MKARRPLVFLQEEGWKKREIEAFEVSSASGTGKKEEDSSWKINIFCSILYNFILVCDYFICSMPCDTYYLHAISNKYHPNNLTGDIFNFLIPKSCKELHPANSIRSKGEQTMVLFFL